MKKFLCAAVFACLLFTAGCGQSDAMPGVSFQLSNGASGTVAFINGMGCSDPGCTDASHHHDCPPDCEDYEHYHNCDMNCTDADHHHAGTDHEGTHHSDSATVAAVSFINGMGCSDPGCTDASHHHDCPPDCEDYEHHHNCDMNCTDADHHHGGASSVDESEQHHTEQRHGDDHH